MGKARFLVLSMTAALAILAATSANASGSSLLELKDQRGEALPLTGGRLEVGFLVGIQGYCDLELGTTLGKTNPASMFSSGQIANFRKGECLLEQPILAPSGIRFTITPKGQLAALNLEILSVGLGACHYGVSHKIKASSSGRLDFKANLKFKRVAGPPECAHSVTKTVTVGFTQVEEGELGEGLLYAIVK